MRAEASRRITGPHPVMPETGAAMELFFDDGDDVAALLAALREAAVAGAEDLGWEATVHTKVWAGGATFGLTAPPDLWMVCAEWLDELGDGLTSPTNERFYDADDEREPALRELVAWGRQHGVPILVDDDGVGVGAGVSGRVLPRHDLADDASAIVAGDWRPAPLPAAGVTGTNGKTTTTRLIDHLLRTAGLHAGHTSSDGVRVGGEWLERGDWSGPTAARRLCRTDVGVAVFELARGGLLRRGLAAVPLDVAVVTNVSADHLGEYGVDTVADVARVKLFVSTLLKPGGTLVVNADCAPLMAEVPAVLAGRPDVVLRTFSLRGPADAVAVDGQATLHGAALGAVADWPITLAGTAAYNVENALAAALAASALGLDSDAVVAGLRTFLPDPESSPGRGNLLALDGATWVLDFGHNPDGVQRLAATTAQWDYSRRLVTLSQAGDRTDALLDELGTVAVQAGFDIVLAKALPGYGRGRSPMAVAERIAKAARDAGATHVEVLPDELSALHRLLELARPGDVVLYLVHETFDEAISLLMARGATLLSGPPLPR